MAVTKIQVKLSVRIEQKPTSTTAASTVRTVLNVLSCYSAASKPQGSVGFLLAAFCLLVCWAFSTFLWLGAQQLDVSRGFLLGFWPEAPNNANKPAHQRVVLHAPEGVMHAKHHAWYRCTGEMRKLAIFVPIHFICSSTKVEAPAVRQDMSHLPSCQPSLSRNPQACLQVLSIGCIGMSKV